jgi:hypothetical protein
MLSERLKGSCDAATLMLEFEMPPDQSIRTAKKKTPAAPWRPGFLELGFDQYSQTLTVRRR